MRSSACCLAALAVMMLLAQTASAEMVSFRRSHGGPGDDRTLDIFVDSAGIYTVGSTASFGPDQPNGFLTIFNSDNSHRCSVYFNVGSGSSDEAVALTVHGGRVYVLGNTNFGPNPPNHFIAVFDTTCNLQAFRLYDIGANEAASDIAVEPAATPHLYVVGRQTGLGAYLARINATLHVVWARFFKVRGGDDVAHAVSFSGGRVHVAGDSNDGSSLNMFLSVFDTAGTHVATREIGGASNEQAFDVLVSGGNIYLTGYTDYTGRAQEVILARLDAAYNVAWIKAFGTSSGNERGHAVAAAGGLVYVAGQTSVFGTLDVLLAAFAADGSISHSFMVAGAGGGDDTANGVSSLGACVYPAGRHVSLPLLYVVFDGEVNTVAMSVNTINPPTAAAAPTAVSVSPGVGSFTPSIDTPAAVNSFYSRFCPDALVSTTTTTSTTTVGTTVTTTSTSTVLTTAYAIATTTFTQTSSVILVVSQTTFTTIPTTTTTTQTLSTTTTTTTTSTTSTTTTLTALTTLTQSTTQTATAVTTVVFPEPVSTYILPMLLVLVVVVMATALILRRRTQQPPPPMF
ncbi:MAG: hypothetical protein RMK31_05575 [Candidatus Caldarchaeum sp.]|nr:hypothetical protein [Candidatus Caldarchaeum sp.]